MTTSNHFRRLAHDRRRLASRNTLVCIQVGSFVCPFYSSLATFRLAGWLAEAEIRHLEIWSCRFSY